MYRRSNLMRTIRRLQMESLDERFVLSGIPFSSLPPLESDEFSQMRQVGFGDINGDGHVDIAAHTATNNRLIMMENQGDLTYSEPIMLSEDLIHATHVEVVDFDSDQDHDIFVSHVRGFTWLNNLGGGAFEEVPLEIEATPSFGIMRFSDIDGDNDVDLILDNDREVIILENDGTQNFEISQTIDPRFHRGIELADFDNDGDDDLAVMAFRSIELYLNNDGEFELERNVESFRTNEYASADVDGDGDLDFVNVDRDLTILENIGNAVFVPHVFEDQIEVRFLRSVDIEAADVTGDGRSEILINTLDSFEIYSLSNDFRLAKLSTTIKPSDDFRLVDLDVDGAIDIVDVDSSASSVGWFENTDGQFRPSQVVFSRDIFALPTLPQFVDWDSDTDDDVITSSRNSGSVVWYEYQNETGRFSSRREILSGVVQNRFAGAYDFDGDGGLDLLIAPEYGRKIQWIRNVDGAFDLSRAEDLVDSTSGIPEGVQVIDLDNDNDQDIVYHQLDSISWLENDGVGGFAESQVIAAGLNRHFEIADLDQDGQLDLVGTHQVSEQLVWFPSNGRQGFADALAVSDEKMDQGEFAIGDTDNDGAPEVVGSSFNNSTLRFRTLVFEFTPQRDARLQQTIVSPRRVQPIHFNDFDLDGDSDFMIRDTSVFWFDSLDEFKSNSPNRIAIRIRGGEEPVLHDHDGDGDVDLLLVSDFHGTIRVFRNDTVTQHLRGDYDSDGAITASDIDFISRAINQGERLPELDIDLDGYVLESDFETYLREIAAIPFGDANLDGRFDSNDLVKLFQANGYDDSEFVASWETGDFNGDLRFDSQDLVAAFTIGAYVE